MIVLACIQDLIKPNIFDLVKENQHFGFGNTFGFGKTFACINTFLMGCGKKMRKKMRQKMQKNKRKNTRQEEIKRSFKNEG